MSFDQAKACGNHLYGKGEYAAAAKSYSLAIETANAVVRGEWLGEAMYGEGKVRRLPAAEEMRAPASDIASCYSNRAACHIALQSYVVAEFDASVALELQPQYVKALYRRGQAREALHDFSKALDDMRQVLALDPTVKAAEQAIPRLEALKRRQREERKKLNAEAASSGSNPNAGDAWSSQPARAERAGIEKVEMYDFQKPALPQMLANRKRLQAIHQSGRLAATDIADYKKFISGLANKLKEAQPVIERKTHLLKAKAKQRPDEYDQALRRQQAVIDEWTQEKMLMEKEHAWLVSLPAYQQTLAIVKENFKVDSSGDMYDIEEFETEQEDLFSGSFEDMCREFEREEALGGGGSPAKN